MDLKKLKDKQPWEWPADADKIILDVLRDDQAGESDRLLAVELAGDTIVINDTLAETLLSIALSGDETENLRGEAVISLGPALDHADLYEFENADDILISEKVFRRIQKSLHKLYMEKRVPMKVKRLILEASVRAPQDWHQDAVRSAYSSDEETWKVTAVFCMRFVRGFEEQILEALDNKNPDILYQAVCAAGYWEIDAAWPRIAALVVVKETDKDLLLASIDAAANIRPHEAAVILNEFTSSDDADIVEAACDALAMAGNLLEDINDEEDDNDETTH